PSHAYLGLSPGLDFETKIVVKEDAARLLREELAKPRYACQPIALGTNTDCYQPVERRLRIEEWLRHHEPGKAGHILSLIRQMRGGRLNDPRFGERMRGSGPYADMIRQRCHAACNRLGLNQRDSPLDCNRFVPPRAVSPQLALFQEGSD
ncbi:MAG: hypothetical protein C0522_10865, partial [Rhodocyclaceae bacterium]|nr:hypothetical protein [Rhodocyclaceae bacterium]